MTDPALLLAARFAEALGAAFGPEYAEVDPVIRPSQFADYQANAALALAKRVGASRATSRRGSSSTSRSTTCASRPRSADPGS